MATIGHLLPWGSIGGVEVATLRIIKATRGEFHHVAFCMSKAMELQKAFAEAGAEVVSYDPPEPSLRHFPRFYRESRAVARLLKLHGVALAHCSETKAAYHNSLATVLAGVPLLSHVRSRFPTISLRDRLSYMPIDRYVFVSEASRKQFGLQVADAKARILYDAVDPAQPLSAEAVAEVRQQLGVPEGAALVGMIARVNPQKDYDTLAAAAALVAVRHPEVCFLIVGDNSVVPLNREHYAHVKGRLDALGVTDKFIFTGFRSDVPKILAALDIFVLCTHREGLPLAILEAMSLGKPVVPTDVDGIPEVITHGVTGLLHAHGNAQQLAEAILELINSPDRANVIANAGRELCRNTYNTERFAANTAHIYREMLEK